MASFKNHSDKDYYVVVFTSQRNGEDEEGYEAMAKLMADMAAKQPGFLGMESTRSPEGLGITVSYWEDEEAITNWKKIAAHYAVQQMGQEKWYDWYDIRVAKVERGYSFKK